MKYEIVAEGHEGVVSVDEQVLGTIEAGTPEEAMAAWASKDSRLTWIELWNRWSYGPVRNVFARQVA